MENRLKRTDGLQVQADIICLLHSAGAYAPYVAEITGGYAELARMLNCGLRTAERHMSELHKLGFVAIVPGSGRNVSEFQLTSYDAFNKFCMFLIFQHSCNLAIPLDADGCPRIIVHGIKSFLDDVLCNDVDGS